MKKATKAIRNGGARARIVLIEPWAFPVELQPGEALTFVVTNDCDAPELDVCDDPEGTIQVYPAGKSVIQSVAQGPKIIRSFAA